MVKGDGGSSGAGDALRAVPVAARMTIVLYADGNWAYEAPIANLPVCHTLVGLMAAELAALQYERTHRQGGQIVLPEGVPVGPAKGPEPT